MKHWLTQLWRLRSPLTGYLQAGGPRKLVVYFQSKPKDLSTRGAHVQEQKMMETLAQTESKFTPSLFVLLKPPTECMMPTSTGEGYLLYSVFRFKCSPLPQISS